MAPARAAEPLPLIQTQQAQHVTEDEYIKHELKYMIWDIERYPAHVPKETSLHYMCQCQQPQYKQALTASHSTTYLISNEVWWRKFYEWRPCRPRQRSLDKRVTLNL